MRIGGCGQVLAQSLCARLANMERCTDGTDRGNAIGRQIGREHHRGLPSKRIDRWHTAMRARHSQRRLRATDDHHQKLIRAAFRRAESSITIELA